VIPYDKSRVKLTPVNGDESTDYINANWVYDMIEDEKGEKKRLYISTQGPIKRENMEYEQENVDTCPDFWRMVFDNNSHMIVMLTKLSEDMRETEKCSLYWPPNKGETRKYGDINVKLIDDHKDKDLKISTRKFEVWKADNEKDVSNVVQIQYTGWPDHGVPSNEDAFIKLTEIVDQNNVGEGPMVVHCSAGIGRSGTFCAIHSYVRYLRKYYKEHNDIPDINIPRRLIELRKDRPKMIQTKEQYEFVYRAIFKVFGSLFDEFEAKRSNEDEKDE